MSSGFSFTNKFKKKRFSLITRILKNCYTYTLCHLTESQHFRNEIINGQIILTSLKVQKPLKVMVNLQLTTISEIKSP
jgi:hypothetical protein